MVRLLKEQGVEKSYEIVGEREKAYVKEQQARREKREKEGEKKEGEKEEEKKEEKKEEK